jgi:5-methyltetrahydrofolate corrinoid/iron sulfur protein methyltransferase
LSTLEATPRFIVIGENIHTSRVVRVNGSRIGRTAAGMPAVRVPVDGGEGLLPVAAAIQDTREFRSGRVKHVMAAVLEGMSGGPDAELAATYVRWMAARQIAGGAAYLDLNVDEVSPDVEGRLEAMAWLVQVVGPVTTVPLSIDSSDTAVMAVGLDLYDPGWAGGAPPLLNSAAADRTDVLDLAVRRGCPVVLSSTGEMMPTGTEERMVRAVEMIEMALEHGLALSGLFVDPLIIPIGVDSEAGSAYLDAVRQLRERYGPELHITGGVSNVSFGMPGRRLIGDVFLDLCVLAGQDSGIVDPVASDVARALSPDRESKAYRLAAALLTGADAFGVEFIEAYRAGRLSGPAPAAIAPVTAGSPAPPADTARTTPSS